MFRVQHLFNEDNDAPMEDLKSEKLNHVMNKFIHLCLPNFQNLITFSNHNPRTKNYIDSIYFLRESL
jgi:hypothetical protein